MGDREIIEMVTRNLRDLSRTIDNPFAALFIEAQINALAQVGSDIVDGLNKTEREFLHAGQLINAVKEHRTRTGASLKESKDLCDAYRVKVGIMPAYGY